jgi:glycosyltransferase involved in cell wall biosynthesis
MGGRAGKKNRATRRQSRQFKSVKLAFISTVRGYRWAGSEEFWYATALKALQSGHQVTAYVHQDIQYAEQIQNLVAQEVKVYFRQTLHFSRLWPLKEKIAPSFPLRQFQSFDVILLSLGSLLDVFYVPGLLEALRRSETPFVLFCQFNAEGLAFTPSQRAALRELAGSSAGCCFVSQQNLELAERQLAMKLPNTRVIGNPIRVSLPQPLPWPDGPTIRFGCVARLETLWKGQDLLLEILSKPPWTSRDWTLSFFGEGPDSEHLQNAAKFFGLEKRVEFRGYVRDLKNIWSNHHLMILPSRGEGLPLAILEAMMCGRPTVATDVGGNREILEDGVTGFIADAATPSSFGKTLERAWSERSCWQQMGQAAHLRAQSMAATDPSQKLLDYLAARTTKQN